MFKAEDDEVVLNEKLKELNIESNWFVVPARNPNVHMLLSKETEFI